MCGYCALKALRWRSTTGCRIGCNTGHITDPITDCSIGCRTDYNTDLNTHLITHGGHPCVPYRSPIAALSMPYLCAISAPSQTHYRRNDMAAHAEFALHIF